MNKANLCVIGFLLSVSFGTVSAGNQNKHLSLSLLLQFMRESTCALRLNRK